MTRNTADLPGVSSKKGTKPTGSQESCIARTAGRPIAFLVLNRSTRSMAGSLTTCERNGSAARIPTSKLLAPRARAYAAIRPPLPRLNIAPEARPSQASSLRLFCASSLVSVGRGRRKLGICIA